MVEYNIDLNGKTILITGVAGFIGSKLAMELYKKVHNIRIIGIDNMNEYYDVSLKEKRVDELVLRIKSFVFLQEDITNKENIISVFRKYKPQIVINLAAQAGVRNSIINPDAYIMNNIIGFYNILEACRELNKGEKNKVLNLVYASSSSVYGSNTQIPFSINATCESPSSLYAATKKSNELMAYVYSKLYDIPTVGLRFFSVYGPNGRPDMLYFKLTDKLKARKRIQLYNYGKCMRDFTYIDDIVKGILYVLQYAPMRKNTVNGKPIAPYKIYNLGKGKPENLYEFVKILVEELKRVHILSKNFNVEKYVEFTSMQSGDVEITWADTTDFKRDFGYVPDTSLREGLRKFSEWYAMEYDTKCCDIT